MRKTSIYAIVALAMTLAVVLSRSLYSKGGKATAESSTASPAVVAVARVGRADLARTLTLSAELEPYQQIQVHAKVAGFVKSIRVDVGDHVTAGDTIAVLEIPEANDDLKRATAGTQAAHEEVKRAQAHFDDVHAASQRLREVAKRRPDLVAQQDIDTANARDEDGEAGLASARQHVEESQANESRMLTMVAYGKITAPFSGVVTKRYADTGALIQAGTSSNTQAMPVVSLAQDDLLRLRFPIPESAVPFIHVGTPVDVVMSAGQRAFKGRVARFSRQVDRATRTMVTEVDVANPDSSLTPGMYASASVTLERRDNVVNVPVQALAAGTALVVTSGGRIEQRKVRTGLETPERVEVVDGLREKDLVVVGGRAQLRSGDLVVPKLIRDSDDAGSDRGQ
jgi:RND family efflux transporter MFP subunit